MNIFFTEKKKVKTSYTYLFKSLLEVQVKIINTLAINQGLMSQTFYEKLIGNLLHQTNKILMKMAAWIFNRVSKRPERYEEKRERERKVSFSFVNIPSPRVTKCPV